MKLQAILLTLLVLLTDGSQSARADLLLPGTPLGGGSFGPQDLSLGGASLPGLVQPGDVVLFETPQGNASDRGTWSDVVRFFNFGGNGFAFLISDGENGVGDVSVNPVLPANALSPNAQLLTEIQSGTGTDSDITTYVTPTATYNIHSDAPQPEGPPETGIVPGGPPDKINRFVTLTEGANEGIIPQILLFTVQGGTAKTADGNDTITFFPFLGLTLVFGTSDSAADMSPFEIEHFQGINNDEGVIDYAIYSIDAIPEPSSLALAGLGALCVSCYGWCRRRPSSAANGA